MAPNLKTITQRTIAYYALLAMLWIFISDQVIYFFATDSANLTWLQTYKGLFYVIITSILLYLLLRSQLKQWDESQKATKLTQQALLVSNDYLKAVLDATDDAILVIDPQQGKIIDANQRVYEIFGYSPAEIIDQPISSLGNMVEAYSLKKVYRWAARVRREGAQVMEWQARRKNGHQFWVEINLRYESIGKKNRFIMSVRDIDHKKKIENNLQKNERMLNTLVGNLPGMVYRCENTPEWTMTYLSEGVFALTGYRAQDLLGDNNISFGKLIHPEDSQHVWEEIQNALGMRRSYTLVYRIIDVSDTEKWVWEHGRGVFNEKDQLLFLEGFITDISEQKKSEQKLREINTRLNVLINATPDIICFKDGQNRWLEANKADLELFRLSNIDYRGKTDRELAEYTDPIYREAFLKCEESDEHAWAKANISRGEETIPTPDGESKVYDVIKAPIFANDGTRAGLIVFGRDITDRKIAEQALYKRFSEMEALRAIDRAIISSFEMQVTLDVLLRQAIHHLEANAAAILILDDQLQTMKYVAAQGFRASEITTLEIRPGQGFTGEVMLNRQPIKIADPALIEKDKSFARMEGFAHYCGAPLIARGQMKGILEIYQRTVPPEDPEWDLFLETLANQTAIAIDNAQMFESLQHKNLELALAYDATIAGWSRALELRQEESPGHIERISQLTMALAQELDINKNEFTNIRHGVLLHDIGKMAVPDKILLKKGQLTPKERKIMQEHPAYAHQWLSDVGYLKNALDIPLYHHEKWDGSGYPHGLRGEQIPLSARLFAVVDVWDALTSDRPYRKAWAHQEAINYLREQRGQHFDPQIVDVFLRMITAT